MGNGYQAEDYSPVLQVYGSPSLFIPPFRYIHSAYMVRFQTSYISRTTAKKMSNLLHVRIPNCVTENCRSYKQIKSIDLYKLTGLQSLFMIYGKTACYSSRLPVFCSQEVQRKCLDVSYLAVDCHSWFSDPHNWVNDPDFFIIIFFGFLWINQYKDLNFIKRGCKYFH